MNKKVVYIVVAVVLVGLLSALIFVGGRNRDKVAEEAIENAELIIRTKENPDSVMKEYYEEGYSPVKAYYLGYDFESPKTYWDIGGYGFYSELRNEKGDVVAEYEPYLLLKGETAEGKEDCRIILFEGDYTVTSDEGNGEEAVWDKTNTYPFEVIDYFASQVLEATGCDPSQGTPLEIYGTCDDAFIYVEKMVWYDIDFNITYTYTAVNTEAKKGTVPVENWIKTLKDEKFLLYTCNSPCKFSVNEQDEEAKEICKELSEDYIKVGCDLSKLNLYDNKADKKIHVIKRVEDLGNGYFVSTVFVIHPYEIRK